RRVYARHTTARPQASAPSSAELGNRAFPLVRWGPLRFPTTGPLLSGAAPPVPPEWTHPLRLCQRSTPPAGVRTGPAVGGEPRVPVGSRHGLVAVQRRLDHLRNIGIPDVARQEALDRDLVGGGHHRRVSAAAPARLHHQR